MSSADMKIPPEFLPGRMQAGLDLGSRVVKICILGGDGAIHSRMMDAVPFILRLRAHNTLDLASLGIGRAMPVVTTGYGRAALNLAQGISEIRAHFKGALAQTGLEDFTLVELGGQDSKVLHVQGGRVMDFATNDRCAAGTGRYLENMARMLGVSLEELSSHHAGPVDITNTCATFGETELLARLLEGVEVERIMAGVNMSVARRVRQMVKRYNPRRLIFCGGVALNQAVVRLTGEIVGCPVIVPPEPQLNGALGCALEEAMEHE